jgi:hypothetical protein
MYRTGFCSDGDGSVGTHGKPSQPWGHIISTETKQMMAIDPVELTADYPAAYHFLWRLASSLSDLMIFYEPPSPRSTWAQNAFAECCLVQQAAHSL